MTDSKTAALVGIYAWDLRQNLYLLEMTIHEKPKAVDLSQFFQEDAALPRSEWQVPCNELYLAPDGSKVLGDFFSRETIPGDETRVVFFMFLETLLIPLSTPYGEFDLSCVQSLPERLSKTVSFCPVD